MTCYKHPQAGTPTPGKVSQHVYIPSLYGIPSYCHECKGTCYVPGDQKVTQQAVIEKFGILHNECVDGSMSGDIHCPYHRN